MPDLAVQRTKKPKIHKVKAGMVALTLNVMSVAAAIEALELLLVEKGVLQTGELEKKLDVVKIDHWAKGQNVPPEDD